MFYWFVESSSSPASAPVILWTNGGPGCSGLGGFLTEQGPLRAMHVQATNETYLKLNEHAWNTVANMIFIEQPVGVGFSTVDKDISYGDSQAAEDNHHFILGFFERFSNYKNQSFYIASESYGGHYMPTLAKALIEGGQVPHFAGVFLGNPLTYMQYRNYGMYGTAWGHQLVPRPLWDSYQAAGCKSSFPVSAECGAITDKMDQILSAFDPYALDFPKCETSLAVGRHERWTLRRAIRQAQQGDASLKTDANDTYQACAQDFATTYLNMADVREAIHVKSNKKWELCSDIDYSMIDVNKPMMPVWSWLLNNTDLNIMIYSGDDDSVCATLGSQQFVWDLKLQPKTSSIWAPWKVDDQVAGFRTDFSIPHSSKATFSFVTVHGAGHMVPATQPKRSLELLKSFLDSGRAVQEQVTIQV